MMAQSQQPNHDREDRNDLIEETLGFNFRSVNTLYMLLRDPARVMQAIIDRDRTQFTPMIRLFLALVGIQVAVSVLWGGHAGLLRGVFEELPADQSASLEALISRPLDDFFELYGMIVGFLHPIFISLSAALAVVVLRSLGDRRPLSVDLNLMFATLTAGSIVGLVLLPAQTLAGLSPVITITLVTLAYFLTLYRGLPETITPTAGTRWGNSILLTLVLIILVMTGGVVMQMLAVLATFLWP